MVEITVNLTAMTDALLYNQLEKLSIFSDRAASKSNAHGERCRYTIIETGADHARLR